MPLAPKDRKRFDEVRLSWVREGSSLDPLRLVVAVARSAAVDWTGFGFLNKCFFCLVKRARYSA